ncbi:MAG: AraC family transcriptional regulator [Clostridia bacterium]|nr:AraC family transcriptional regulator [Clostridia bacterium]
MEYKREILAAIDYIEKKLTEKITVEDISSRIYISVYHLHSIFLAGTGGSIGEYIKKRRLTEAAIKLIDTQIPILEIALEYCYNSQEAFTRAFKSHYGVTPFKYRMEGNHRLYCHRFRISEGDLIHHAQRGISQVPEIITIGEIHLVGLSGESSYQDSRIQNIWDNFNEKYDQLALPKNNSFYSVCTYQPNLKINEISTDFAYTLFIGVEQKSLAKVPEGFILYTIPSGKYAVFKHIGDVPSFSETYRYIFSEWIPKSCYEVSSNFDFEYYKKRFTYKDKRIEGCIHVPIK